MISSNAASGIMAGAPPRAAATAPASPAGSSPATRSPSRWEQLIPAACMNVASPSSSAHSASQVARSREVSSRGRPVPPSSALISGFVRFRRPGSAPPQTSPVPADARRGQQPGVVAGQHRHGPRAGAAHGHDHAAGPARDVGAAHLAQVAADQPGAGAQADQPRRPHPPLRRGLGVRER